MASITSELLSSLDPEIAALLSDAKHVYERCENEADRDAHIASLRAHSSSHVHDFGEALHLLTAAAPTSTTTTGEAHGVRAMLHNVEASAKAALGAVQDNVSAGIHNALQFVAGADPTGETVLISGSGSAAQCSWAPAQTSAL